MKKWLIYLIILIVIPSVYATISIEGPQKTTFNLGDEVKISGFVLRNEAFSGF